jgi:hypothetical protein
VYTDKPTGRRIYLQEHRVIWEEVNGSIPENFVVHHINEDKADNKIENLSIMHKDEHNHLHNPQTTMANHQEDPAGYQCECMEKLRQDPDKFKVWRKHNTELQKKYYHERKHDPEYITRIRKNGREAMARLRAKVYADPVKLAELHAKQQKYDAKRRPRIITNSSQLTIDMSETS